MTARRDNLERFSEGEKAIWDATQIVECMGADPALTDAVVLLCQARQRVADFVDAQVPRDKDTSYGSCAR